MTYTAKEDSYWKLEPEVSVVAGKYQASVQLNGQTYAGTSASVDISRKLDVPSEIAFSEAANQTVTLGWQKVNDAVTYGHELYQVEDSKTFTDVYGFTNSLSVTFPEAALDVKVEYAAIIAAFNVLIDNEDLKVAAFPPQFNVSYGYSAKSVTRVP